MANFEIIAKEFANSYKESDVTLFSSSLVLPDKNEVISVIEDIQHLFFPAYFDVANKSYEAEEFAHLIDLSFLEDDYCIALVHPSAHPQRNIEIINLARSITNHVCVISPHLNASVNDLELGIDFSEELSPISFVIPLQLLAAMTAEKLGIDTSVFPHPDVQSIAHSADYFLYNS